MLVSWTEPQDTQVVYNGSIQIEYMFSTTGTTEPVGWIGPTLTENTDGTWSTPWLDGGTVSGMSVATYIAGISIIDFQFVTVQIRSVRPNGATSAWVTSGQDMVSIMATLPSAAILPNVSANSGNNCTLASTWAGATAMVSGYGPGGTGTGWQFLLGANSTTYPAFSITGLTGGTVYAVMLDPVAGVYSAVTAFDPTLPDGLIFVGSLTTATSTAGGTSGGGGTGGGTGGKPVETL
jgi:hypothetical protein